MTPPITASATVPAKRGILRPSPAVAALAFLKLGLLLACASAYGYYRDELYYLACARRLAWGYVDHPPLSFGLLAFASRLYGETLLSLRLFPALVGAIVIVLTARLAKRFGAGALGQAFAGLAVLAAPALLATDHIFTMESFAVLFGVVAAGLFARALEADPVKGSTLPWARVGLVLGLGTLNKLSMIPLGLALFLGISASTQRSWLRHRSPAFALGIATTVLVPYISWQKAHAWPTLEVLSHEAEGCVHLDLAGFLAFARGEIFGLGPLTLGLAVVGLVALFRSAPLAPYRWLGIAFVVMLIGCVFGGGRGAHELLPLTPVLLAAGGAAIEPWLMARRWRTPVTGVAFAVSLIVSTPLAIPILRVAQFQAYARALHLAPPASHTSDAALPERFADMYGWPELVHAVASVYVAIPPLDRDDTIVLANNYGEAGALELFGEAVGLPRIISGHDQYWFWGPGDGSATIVIAVGVDEALLHETFKTVELATVFGHSLAVPEERHVRIYICRGPTERLDVLWPRFKKYD